MMCTNLHGAYHSTCSFMEVINPSGMKAGVSGCPNLGLMWTKFLTGNIMYLKSLSTGDQLRSYHAWLPIRP